MLKFVNSGLSQTEVRRAHAQRNGELTVVHVWRVLAVAIACGVSIAVLTELFLGMIAAVVMSIALGVLTVAVAQRIATEMKVIRNDAVPVQVIRAGLVRQITAGEVVVRDVVVLHAGEIVPVDVAANGKVLLTGSVARQNVSGVAVAVGSERTVAQQLTVQGHTLTLEDVQAVLRALVAAFSPLMILPRIVFGGMRLGAGRLHHLVQHVLAALNAGPIASKHVDSRRLAVAFVQNQGTIATSPVRHTALPS